MRGYNLQQVKLKLEQLLLALNALIVDMKNLLKLNMDFMELMLINNAIIQKLMEMKNKNVDIIHIYYCPKNANLLINKF